jgi:mono/diheme cytochrome c family protein/glucose/arabinose dehydrogenase
MIGCAIAAAVSLGGVYHAQTGAWPPAVQRVSEASPPLSPAAAMKTFYMPPGYHLELVASEPLVQDPIFMDWDFQGRLWVIEMPAFIPDLGPKHDRDPVCDIVVLEDTNNDGKMDKRTVFADKLILPRTIKIIDRGVLVAEPPNLWLMRDTNGDLKADTKELLTDTFGDRDASVEHNANSLFWALDNWMYTSEHTKYYRLKNGKLEVAPTLPRGQWGATQDDVGHIFRNTNSQALNVDLVSTRYYLRNPNLARTRGMYESLVDETRDLNVTWPVRPNRGVNRGYQTGQLRPDGTLATYTAVGSPTVYRGDRLPRELYGNVFLSEPSGNLVSRVILNDEGTTLRAKRAYERAEFLASTDERFRPVWLSSAPDGTLYVVDMYRGIIQYIDLVTKYLNDWIVKHDLQQGIHYGRIYRVVHDTTRRDRAPALGTASPATLVATLSHPNGWWRDSAQQLLVQRHDLSVVPSLKQLANGAPLARTRIQALWTLDGLDAIDPATVISALDNPSRDVRVSALRISERWLGDQNSPVVAAVLKRAADTDPAVRRQLAATLGELKAGPQKEDAIATLLVQHGDDPITVDAALSGIQGSEPVVLDKLLQTAGQVESAPLDGAIPMLAAAIARSNNEAATQRLFAAIMEENRAAWQRSAVLRGVELATGAAGGGGRGRGAAALNADTGPGGRGAPEGDRAYPLQRGDQNSAVFFGANPPPAPTTIKMTREPDLVAFSARDKSELAARVTRVLARVEWPGKPGAPRAAAALTAQEQQRFDSGRSVYAANCLGCHQDDGRGLPGLAPPLAGSAMVLAPAGVTARIVLNGKEGAVGLMPPIGGKMSDDEVAAVLTYIRREWGNTGSPIDAATARDIRAISATRTRPWTDEELARIGDGAVR